MKQILKTYAAAYHNEVTGSRILLTVEMPDTTKYRILVDYGYFQEVDYRYLNYVDDLNPESIDAIILTHNHIDHTGLVPKAVKQGYRNKIYMTEITQELIGNFWRDSANQQEENAHEMRERYPDEAHRFHALYHDEDVENSMKLIVRLPYRKTVEIFPGIKLSFWENSHILGAGMVLLQCSYHGCKSQNHLFTGDFKFDSVFTQVPSFPKWFRNMELIMYTESTYGSIDKSDIQYCFKDNILEAFNKKQNILIGAFAQGRMQEILYDFKCFQDEGLIPPEYEICVDGPLGISTTFKYQKILQWYNPSKKDFIPTGIRYVSPMEREHILDDGIPKILITTSGMLSNGPAKTYVPIFLEHPNSLIHLVGYAAEETLARKLLEAESQDTVKIGDNIYHKRAVVKSTREKTSHATKDELLKLINMFTNVRFLGINHGNADVKEAFYDNVFEECPNVETAGILNRNQMYRFYSIGDNNSPNARIVVKTQPTGFLNDSKLLFGKEASKKDIFGKTKKSKKKNGNKSKKKNHKTNNKNKGKKPKYKNNSKKTGRRGNF